MWSWESSNLIQNLYWNLVLILSLGWFYLSRGVGNKIIDSKTSSSMTLGLKKILLGSLVSWICLILVSFVNLSKNQNGSKLVLKWWQRLNGKNQQVSFHLHNLLESYSQSKCWWATPSSRWTPPHLNRLLLFFIVYIYGVLKVSLQKLTSNSSLPWYAKLVQSASFPKSDNKGLDFVFSARKSQFSAAKCKELWFFTLTVLM